MGGIRLAVHSIFVVQLICLVTISFLYASTRPFNPSFSAEPFISDQSGWKLLEESTDLVPLHDGSIGGYVREYLDKLVVQVKILLELGGEEDHVRSRHERQTSVFVQQMQQKISELPMTFINDSHNDDGKNPIVLPQLKMNLYMPFIDDAKIIDSISRAFQKGLQGSSSSTKQIMASPGINLTTITDLSKVTDIENMKSCDEWEMPEPVQSNRNTRQIKSPDLYVLTGCSKSSVDVPLNSDAIVIRTTYTDKDVNGLEHHLQSEISPILLKIVYGAKKSKQRRLERISVQLIDEDPSSHASASAKLHFELLSKAFYSSLQSIVAPMLSDLSLLYGGNVDVIDHDSESTRTLIWKDAIELSSSSLAYRQLPNDVIEMEEEGVDEAIKEDVNGTTSEAENASVVKKFITTQQMSRFIQSQSSQQNDNEDVEWVVFLPSKDHSPLFLRDKVTGDKGQSIILSSESTDISKPAGMSLLEIDNVNGMESDEMNGDYRKSISHSLIYLAGYIRELSGLPPSLEQCTNLSSSSSSTTTTTASLKCLGENTQQLSFWELESIAQSHWHPVLQYLLHEIDAVMSLLHGHGSTLALPEHVAQKINKATQLLRQSISFAEEGLPVMYATSILYAALEQIESVQMASDLFELPYFAPDHYLAVFSPLVLPLMMPMIFGLLRELKRYKELKRKRKSA